MRRIGGIVSGVLSVLAVVSTAGAAEYTGPGFAADLLAAQNGGALQPVGSIYMSRSVLRMETNDGALLIDLNSGNLVMLMPDQGMYMEMPSGTGMAPDYESEPCAAYNDREKQGTETVSGRATTKWRCLGQHKIASGPAPSDTTMWFDDTLKFWIREVRDSGETTELRNIEAGAQPDSLFKIPDGLQKLTMPTGQGLPQQ